MTNIYYRDVINTMTYIYYYHQVKNKMMNHKHIQEQNKEVAYI